MVLCFIDIGDDSLKFKYTPVKCYHCNKMIDTYEEHIIKEIPYLASSNKVVMKNRNLHKDCADELINNIAVENENQKEKTDWDKVYQKWKNILNIPENKNVDKYTVLRLRALRVNKYMPKQENVLYRNVGYSYDTIYKTLVFCENKMRYALKTIDFTDNQHKTNYLLKIVDAQLPFIDERNRQQQRAKEIAQAKLLQADLFIDDEEEFELFISEEDRRKEERAQRKYEQEHKKN